MKCQANGNEGICGADIPPNSKYCPGCGNKVVRSDDRPHLTCPKCLNWLVKGQKFCSNCAWPIDPNIFEENRIYCKGILNGKTCGAELLQTSDSCQTCGTKCNVQATGSPENMSESSSKLMLEPHTSSGTSSNIRQSPAKSRLDGSSESSSSSRSNSPDTWKSPGSLTRTPESGESTNDIRKESSQKEKQASENDSGDKDLEMERSSPNDDNENNNLNELGSITNAENPQSVANDGRPSQNTASPPELKEEETASQSQISSKGDQMTTVRMETTSLDTLSNNANSIGNGGNTSGKSSNSGDMEVDKDLKSSNTPTTHPTEGIPQHFMITGDNQTSRGHVKELTQRFERQVSMEDSDKKHGNLQREISQSSGDASTRGSEEGSDAETSSGEEEEGEEGKNDATTGQQYGVKRRRNKPKGSKGKRDKKRARKERNTRRKLNIPEPEKNNTSLEEISKANNSKEKPYNTRSSRTQATRSDTQKNNSVEEQNMANNNMEITYETSSSTNQTNTAQTQKTPTQEEKHEGTSVDQQSQTEKIHSDEVPTGKKEDEKNTSMEEKNKPKDNKEKPYDTRSSKAQGSTTQAEAKGKNQQEKSSNSSSSTNSKTTNKQTGQRAKENSEVCFHIITSPDLLKDPDKGHVMVKFQSSTSDGSKCRSHILSFKRMLTDKYLEYEGTVKISKDILTQRIYYAYFVSKKKGSEVTDIEEYIYCHSSEVKHRMMWLKNSEIKDIIHVYDGVIKKKPEKDQNKGVIKTIKGWFTGDDYKKHLKTEASFAFQSLAPEIQMTIAEKTSVSGEEMMYHVECLLNGLKETYQVTAGLWHNGAEFMSYIKKELHDYVSNLLSQLYKKKDRHVQIEDQVLHLSAAVGMVCLVDAYGIELSPEEEEKLCKALLPVLSDAKKCSEYESLKLYFKKTMPRIKTALLNLIKRIAGKTKKSCWFYCIPLWHYILGKYQPYDLAPAKVDHDERIPHWWGIAEIKDEVDMFKGKSSWDRRRKEVLDSLKEYFAFDYFLPRVFLACLNFHNFTETIPLDSLPPDATIATLCFHLKTNYYDHFEIDKSTALAAIKILDKLSVILLELSKNGGSTLEASVRCWKIANNLLELLHTKHIADNKKAILNVKACEVFFISVDWFAKCWSFRQSQGKAGTYDDHITTFDKHRRRLKDILSSEWFLNNEEKFLKIWNTAMEIRIPEGEMRATYQKYLRDELERTLQNRSSGHEHRLVELYCDHVETFSSSIQEVLSKLAFRAVQRGSNMYTGRTMSTIMRYGTLLSEVFERSIDLQQMANEHTILDYILTWAPFATYVKFYYNEEYSKSLKETSRDLMSNFIEVIKVMSEQISKGTVVVQDLLKVLDKVDHFKLIVTEVKDLPVKAEYLIETLPLREKELLTYRETLLKVQDFVCMCNRFKANTGNLEERINKVAKIEDISLSLLCKIAMLDEIKNREHYKPSVLVFGLEDQTIQTLPHILECGKGLLFINLWDERGNTVVKEKGKSLEIDEILEEVWEPTYELFNSICTRLRSGELKFSEFEKYFKTSNLVTLREELSRLIPNEETKWVEIRLDQLQKYRDLRNCLYGAQVIMDVVKEYKLTGNFNQITEILKLAGNADTKMNTLDDSMMQTCAILSGINEKKANCLKTFCQCKPLVDWLKKTMPSGLKELKVFVDLASISAGEGDYEIGKVNCLHSATTGYAPLIFNLDNDCNAVTFLGKCQEVWKELDSNEKLPQKLIDTQRQLDWLKSVKQTHGSVEVTSLAQAEAINANGIYQVGNLKKTASIKNPTLREVLELRVTEAEDQKLQRNHYRYDQLHDLQSRLMLVAGKAEKGKDEVDRFMLVLDSVVRLGNIYTKLVAEGCVLFSQWHVKFLCDPTRTACAFINFGFGEDKHTLKGRINDKDEDVSAIIPKLAKFMEQCHQKWLEYIDERREKYYLLNYFTIDQMVTLQQELVKIGREEEPSNLIYPLLSAVRHGCTKEDLVKAMATAKQDKERLESQREQEMEDDDHEDETENEAMSDNAKVAKFLQVMTEIYPMDLAKEALKHVPPEDIDAGLEWCMENEDDFIPDTANHGTSMDLDDGSRETTLQRTQFSGWTESEHSLASITANLVSQLGVESSENSVDKLIKALEELWLTFLNSISSSVSDYLSVDHLGLILNRLAEQEELIIDRTFLPSFTPGEPNLIICPQSEIYNMLLAVYSHEDDKPLPQHDEVLLCTPHTTLDMVEIFWRRALFADNNKVYCLVNSDLLDYDVSDRGERTLERLMKSADIKGIKYRLVVICSSENEYKSRIVSALDKFHRPQLPINMQNIREYLLTKLRVEKHQSGVKPACSVDFEKCSVRIVKSWRAGVGKTLYKKRMVADLNRMVPNMPRNMASNVTIPLHEKTINTDSIMDTFLKETLPPRCHEPRIFHIDISHEVQEGVDAFLFQLLVLGCLGHSSGHVWRKSDLDYYIIESMPLLIKGSDNKLKCLHHCLEILPHVLCRSPQESLEILSDTKRPSDYSDHDRLFDSLEFKSPTFQRPFQYLKRLDTNCKLDDVNAHTPEGDRKQCLHTLLRHCGIQDPSWSELHHFVSFLNKQLEDFNGSAFCGLAAMEDLPGFAKFVLRFLIQMSRDFSTRSLKVSEESPIQLLQRQISEEEEERQEDDNVIQLYQMRRKWETSPHPYLFFNPDHHSMTFLGFNIDRRTGNLSDQQTGEELEQGIMQPNLFDALVRNRVNLAENFDNLPRAEKIMKLCNVMGLDMVHDPDDTYELTTDNVKKILAIYMRFRCDIPVIIMGETGCGKTRLIKFMCNLQQPPGITVENMILMKVHGGTRVADIVRKVKKAEEIAQKNATDYPFMDTVLFFDEANTTEAIGVIKEIMCDKSLGGKPIKLHDKLKIVAACNPYRKHSEELIKRLEQAGLGYHVDADKTTDRLGRVPMRRLVYRVQPLPQSMLPLVWDFGQLNTEVEEMYIRQMVLRYIKNNKLPSLQGLENVVSKILTVSQDFMRDQKDECSFVSLRDVERVLEVMSWFYRQSEDDNLLFRKMREEEESSEDEDEDEEMEVEAAQETNDITRSLVLALGVCYHACLKNRDEYREAVAKHFRQPLVLPNGADQIKEEISRCQTVFLENVELAANIAKNQALKENVFMMIVCIELRIPMFLVGKPGSSKSLAKTIVADAMQGNAAHKDLFKNYKQAQMVSYQCSPISVPEGIVGTFRQCAAYQKDKDLDRFVSIVVLDEIGLAEDSPKMPLKTLHPLLEDGCPDDEDPEPYKKVAFIGISNWALDPAKMNRGILVQREVPDITELKESAEGICSTNEEVLKLIKPMIEPLADSYLELFGEASKEMREFFGLRDFYSLLKMLYAFVSKPRIPSKPSWLQLKHAILRNFGGLEKVDPVEIFYGKLSKLVNKHEEIYRREDDPDCTSAGMIQACLTGDETNSESRYLLLLTENYGALTILQQKIFNMHNAVVIFGSSFPSDQEYTQVCRNINRIKVCMETGSTVILLNLENLYESLYDALNQYYVEFGGERYVDLGLGTHRVKCRVHRSFRLIVVAEKQIVYNKFPIPLINRLEKHFLSLKTMLTPAQLGLTDKLQSWAQEFCEAKVPAYLRKQKETRKIGDAFMGYHADTCAAIILHVCQEKKCDDAAISQIEKEILHDAKSILLWCATPASIWQLDDLGVFHTYFMEQHHDSLADYLHYKLVTENKGNVYAQITTNSKLMSSADIEVLCNFIPIKREDITLLTLQSFDTEQQFSRQLKSSFDHKGAPDMLLIVQCDCGDQNAELVACARYTVQGELQQIPEDKVNGIHVVFLIQLPGIAGGCFSGFQCGLWHSVHIDELQPAPEEIPSISEMHGKSVSDLLAAKQRAKHVSMDIDNESVKDSDEVMEINEPVEPVELMDIELEEKPKRIFKPRGQFNVSYLIEKCIQPALGNVKDPATDSNRAIKRLTIVLNCIKATTGDFDFMSGITKHLSSILVEKEQNSSLSTNWLSGEASKPENINRAGTFRRFAVHCLESRVIPLLAGIVAFIDTNRNIDILTENIPWKTDIWMQIINDPELTQLRYEFIVSPTRQKELEEVLVKTTSMDGKIFSSVMPFSWLIYQKIDEVLRNTMERSDANEGMPFGTDNHLNTVTKATETFQALPLGRLLSTVEGTYIHDILKAYITDFVHMVHPLQSQEECDLVCESVVIGCKQLIKGDYGRLLMSLVGCHMTFIMHDTRFKNFSYIVHVWPDCCKKILEFQEKESNFYLVTDQEMTLDILALHMLIDHLEPKKEALNKLESRTKWLRQVCDYRPIIERIFGHFHQNKDSKEEQYGKMCQKGVETARSQWTRAMVVKLFIEHVCSTGKDDTDIQRCMTLWTTLRDGADFKDLESLKKVERFLKLCNKTVVKKCFGDQMQCIACENNIEGAPVRLPCNHILCRRCFNDCLTLKEFVCQSCNEEFPPDLNPDESSNKGEVKKYLDYRHRCNSFFMEVVSQLCFAEGTPPSQEVIEKLLSYILGQTTKKVDRVVSRELTIFDDSIDPTPVVRSFLLQQLMQTSNHEIESHLKAYFEYAGKLVDTKGDNQQLVELCLLILQCMEDYLHQQNANTDDEITTVTRFLKDTCHTVTDPDVELLDKIDDLSRVLFSLSVVAKYTHKLYGSAQSNMPDPKVRRMFDQAARLCDECGSQWPRRYFVKQLCRCYGIDSYQTVSKNNASFLRWIRLPELAENKVKECHDRYVVLGEEYKELRETIVTTVLNENSDKLQELLQSPANDWQTRIRLLLALHREITMNNVYGEQTKKIKDKGKAHLQEFVAGQAMIKNKEVAERILTNTLWRIPGNIDPGMDLADQNIACLLTHYFILMADIPGKTTLLSPLHRISLQPESMVTSFYPTMPQDDLAEIKEAVLAARQQNPGENPVFYRCPNGHPYIIGNCGRAATVGVCKACGREIGGEGYTLRPGNEVDQGRDRTETGHILGRASGTITAPERKLSRPAFAILRLLTHMSMYIGANINRPAIRQSVKPNVGEGEIATYLMEHINLDLASVQNVLGKNKDDVLVLIHYLLARVMNEHTLGVISEALPDNTCRLLDKQSRSKWEEDFSNRYINPVLQNMDKILKENNALILNDKRLGSDPLLQILYETDKPQTEQDITMLHEVPAVWRYRAMITVNHLHQNLEAETKKLPILRLFLKEDHHLRAIRFVPSIIRLQKLLIQKYNKKLDRAEATTLKIEEVRKQMRQDRRLKEFGMLLADYIEAWNCVRESLETYACPANEMLVTVDEKYCRTEITDKTPISHLIPTHKDAGLSSYVLLFFLLKKQNNFLHSYCSKCKIKEESLPKVHVKDISSAHLISYHPDRDLLPLVLANCNYSFEVGQGTRVDYNYTNLERQLMDRFLFSKSIITSIQEIETITYRSESTNGVVLKSLCNRGIQERLHPAVISQICSEVRLKSYPDLCESLDKLDIAISFLKSVGSEPESSLHEFMVSTLKIDSPFTSPKAQQAAQCKHTMSLWVTLASERAKALAKYDKKAFEGVSDNFKTSLTPEQIQSVEELVTKLPTELIDELVSVVFECIVLKVDVPQNTDDEDFVDMSKVCLRDTLIGYVDACPFQGDLTLHDALMDTISQIPSDKEDPHRVLTAHSVEIWCLLNKIYTSKQKHA